MTSIGCVKDQADQPRHGRQAEAARNDRRLLDAARDVFAARGEAATVSAIAERAGVGIGSLYRRYGSKEELLRQLCILAMEETIDAVEEGSRPMILGRGSSATYATASAKGPGP